MVTLRWSRTALILLTVASALLLPSCGGSGSSGGGGGQQPQPPGVPTGLTATAGNEQVALTWSASSGATSYNVGRATTAGGPYTTISSPNATGYTDSSVTNGTTYYYVVSATNSAGTSANSSQVSAAPSGPVTSVNVTIDVLSNRHTISPYVYGGAFPQDAPTITDSGLSVVRWGGNAASTYNWQLGTDNADNDYYFEDFAFNGFSSPQGVTGVSDSIQWIGDVKAANSIPLMTMVMLPWVAQSAEGSGNGHWSFSVAIDGAQCHTDPYNPDAGDGIAAAANCDSAPTYLIASPADLNRTYFPLLDQPGTSDPPNSVYRNQWATALAAAFGSGSCPIPYFSSTSCHFYDMDNEIDIWGGTHRDVHPSPTTYDELQNIYLTEAANLKTWDPQAVRMGWVSCCWYYYWNSAAGSTDKSAHANIDFMPWWLNEIAWNDAVNGARTLDIFDVHAYPETSASGLTTAQAQALALSSTRDWWDPTYTSQAWFGTNSVTTNQPLDTKPFRIPRLRAWANAIYPGTPLSFTEWNFAPTPLTDTDFSTALADVDAYGILGRERMSLASRWTAPSPTNPNYLSLKLFTSYDGAHHGFGTTSVSATHNANPSLFSTYAALNSTGTALTIMVLNKDPANSAQVQFTTTGFTPTNVTTYTLSQSSPTAIVASSSQSWSATQTFAPYSATLLVVSGSMASTPASEWDLNPDTTMVAAGGTVTLQPKLTTGTTSVALGSPQSDTGITVTVTQGNLTTTQNGTITVVAGNTPGFYHYTVQGTDTGATQTQGGWIVVGNPAATFTKTGDNQSAAPGTPLTLSVTLAAGSSGGTNKGANVYFTTDSGTLSAPIVVTDTSGSGIASVILTLPSTSGTVHVTAQGPYGLGHPVATFTETSQ